MTPPLSAEAQEIRAGRITGTTAAGVLGVSPYMTPLAAYQQIMGLATVEPNEAMEWGLELEPVIARRFAHRFGHEIERCLTRRHPELDWLAASGDYALAGINEGLEIKTASVRMRGEWGDPGTDAVPYQYVVQCAVQMAVYGFEGVHVAVLFGGQELVAYFIRRDAELLTEIIERLGGWHRRHVVAGVPPEPTCPSDMLDYLANRYPKSNTDIVEASPEIEDAMREYREASAVEKEAQEIKQSARARMEAFMGEAGELRGAIGKVYWRTPKPSVDVDWRAIVEQALVAPELINAYTTMKAGRRAFRPYLKEAENVSE